MNPGFRRKDPLLVLSGEEQRDTGVDLMRPALQTAKHLGRLGPVLRFSEYHTVPHDHGIGADYQCSVRLRRGD